tara:strand:- start:144 stop:683 length:540 start_codon:yes stop_codon:yes gene_type:complete
MKIGLCGTMSVGKTTLVNTLRKFKEFDEFKFRTERSKYLMDLGVPLNKDSTLKGQTIFLSERANELMCDKIITDRTVIDVMAFAQCSKSMNFIDKDKFSDLAASFLSEYDYIFYVSPEGVDIEDNGIRETDEEYRELIDFTIQHMLSRYRHRIKNLIEIKGTTEERIKVIQETLSPQYV